MNKYLVSSFALERFVTGNEFLAHRFFTNRRQSFVFDGFQLLPGVLE